MKKYTILTALLAILTIGLLNPAYAAEGDSNIIGISGKIGTLGLGADLTVNLGSYLNLRGGYNWLNYERTFDVAEAEVDGELNFGTIPILLDWHPFAGSFRVSGGVVINNNEITLSAKPGEILELEGTDYEVARLNGDVTFDDTAWYIGIGSGNATADGTIHFTCDFGVMFHGTPEISAEAVSGNPTLQALLNADLQAEVDELQDDADAFTIYPVISFGMSIAF